MSTPAAARLPLAELDLESGQAASAEGPIRECLAALQGEKRVRVELPARTLLARVLLAEGKRDAARQELERAAGMASASQSRVHRVEFVIAMARVRAAGGADLAASLKALERAAGEAHHYGFAGLQLEAQLAMGQVEMARSRPGGVGAGQAAAGCAGGAVAGIPEYRAGRGEERTKMRAA